MLTHHEISSAIEQTNSQVIEEHERKYIFTWAKSKFSSILNFRNSILKTCSMPIKFLGAQWLSGRALDSRPKGRGFEPHRRHCIVSLSKNINPGLVLVQPRETRPFITSIVDGT